MACRAAGAEAESIVMALLGLSCVPLGTVLNLLLVGVLILIRSRSSG